VKIAIYARCSTAEQHVENQLLELRWPDSFRGPSWMINDEARPSPEAAREEFFPGV